MYTEHPAFAPPSNNAAKLWRYFDLARFLAVIDRRELFFPSVALLKEIDVFEGFWSPYDFNFHFPKSAKDTSRKKISDEFAPITFVNCWHMSEYESAAMWRYYGEQIAIQTTFARLTQSFPKDEIHAGVVRYIDYATELIHLPEKSSHYALFMTKHHSFEHEKEVRLILPEYPKKSLIPKDRDERKRFYEEYPYTDKGVSISVDVGNMIEAVYVSPKLPSWQTELLERILDKYELTHIRIKPSELGQVPES